MAGQHDRHSLGAGESGRVKNSEVRAYLRMIDNATDRVTLTDWEKEFVNDVAYDHDDWPLTEKQFRAAEGIIDKYLGTL